LYDRFVVSEDRALEEYEISEQGKRKLKQLENSFSMMNNNNQQQQQQQQQSASPSSTTKPQVGFASFFSNKSNTVQTPAQIQEAKTAGWK
jgi:hypothetical protein